jgi:hypothetical protein
MKWNLDCEWKTFDTFYALSSVADYWSESENLIQKAADEAEAQDGPKWTPTDQDEAGEFHEERRIARYLHEEIVTPMFRYSCIVMLATTIERELRRLVKNLEREHGTQKLKVNDIRGDFLGQVAKFVDVFFGLRLAEGAGYQSLRDLQKIRNCIVHCRGEVNLSGDKDKEYLLKLNDRRPGFYASEGIDIQIEKQCIETFIKEAWDFFAWLFGELKWKIDDSWHEKKWGQPLPKQIS